MASILKLAGSVLTVGVGCMAHCKGVRARHDLVDLLEDVSVFEYFLEVDRLSLLLEDVEDLSSIAGFLADFLKLVSQPE